MSGERGIRLHLIRTDLNVVWRREGSDLLPDDLPELLLHLRVDAHAVLGRHEAVEALSLDLVNGRTIRFCDSSLHALI